MAAFQVASTEALMPSVCDQVTVILSCYGDRKGPFPERRILLTRSAPEVLICRASKNESKGLRAARDNAVFDNPVMSRIHAVLRAMFVMNERPYVIIKDSSSHGTFITPNNGVGKEVKLSRTVPAKIQNGTVLRFGIDIFRPPESYCPCVVKFFIEEPERMYTTRQVVQLPPPIDLTDDAAAQRADSPDSLSVAPVWGSDVIDLTSEPEQELQPVRSPASVQLAYPQPIKGRSTPIDYTSESEEDESCLEYSSSIVGASESEAEEETGPGFNSMEAFYESFDDMDEGHDYDQGDYDSVSGSESGWGSDLADKDDEEEEEKEKEPILKLIPIGAPIDSMPEEDRDRFVERWHQFTTGPSNVPARLYATAAAASEHVETGDTSSDTSSDVQETDPGELQDGELPEGSDEDSGEALPVEPNQSTDTPCGLLSPASAPPSRLVIIPELVAPRAPSPSDVFLIGHLPSDARARVLGQKTGKVEYFAARERNREINNIYALAAPVSAIRQTLPGQHVEELKELLAAEDPEEDKYHQAAHRRVPIRDLLEEPHKERETSQPPAPATKRSFDEAFSGAEDTEMPVEQGEDDANEAVEAPVGHVASPKGLDHVATGMEMEMEMQPTEVVGEQINASQRPLKRLKVVGQVAACVALGSAVTFSFLVSTAPVF
ncbi:hypothetical protein F5Y17DRAFT_444597 [Xylariaceae sp. FL0594]|nr:hypothetical protein F5Y17DRAFT_444597 [Xylariaceae sp. FL0594]